MFSVFKRMKYHYGSINDRIIRIFIPLIAIFLLSMFLLSSIFSSLFSSVAQNLIAENYNSSLKMISTYYRQLRFSTVPLLDNLFDDENVKTYIFAKKSKEQAMIDSYTVLENVVARNEYLHSVYIYNENYGFFSSLNGAENLDELSDSTLLNFLSKNPKNQTLYQRQSTFSETNIYFSKDDKTDVQTNLYTICNNSYDKNGKLIYGIILNLSESVARQLFVSGDTLIGKNFYIVNDEYFISHPDASLFGSSIKKNPLIEQINSYDKTSGSKIIHDNDTKQEYLACWYDQAEMNWRLIYLIPMGYIRIPLNNLRNEMILFFIVILIIVNFILFLESKHMAHQLSRENRLIAYLKGRTSMKTFVYPPGELFNMSIFCLSGGKLDSSSADIELMSEIPLEFLRTYLKIDNKKRFLLYTERLTFVFLTRKDRENHLSMLGKLRIDLLDKYDFKLSALCDDVPIPFEDMPDYYFDIKNSLFSYILERKGFVEIYNEKDKSQLDFFVSDATAIENALIHKSVADYESAVINLIGNLKQQKNYELFCSIKIYLANSIQGICSEMFIKTDLIDKEEWKNKVIRSNDYDCLVRNLFRISALITNYNNCNSSRHLDELMDLMKKIVADNLYDLNLSSTMIAEKAGLSLGYARNLFKNHEGLSLNEYFGTKRIEKACSLLISTNEGVNEIREKVGFSNYSYFCTYFKKIKGVSPSSYRLKNRI